MQIQPKIRYLVLIRLSPKTDFRLLDVGGLQPTFNEAQQCIREWYMSVEDLPKAKPEAKIEAQELPFICGCRNCGLPLFKDDVAYHSFADRWCYDCSLSLVLVDGYYDLLE